MKSKSLFPVFFLFASAVLFSCKKNDDKSPVEYLTQAAWKVVKSESDPGTGTYQDDVLEACEKDDMIKFNIDQTYKTTVGTKCDPSDPDEADDSGVWLLTGDSKTITVDGESGSVEKLNNSTFIVVFSDTFGGVTSRYRITFGH